jgi:hypothetical protein
VLPQNGSMSVFVLRKTQHQPYYFLAIDNKGFAAFSLLLKWLIRSGAYSYPVV